MDQTGKYEYSMPFHTLRVDLFEGNVKRMVRGKEYVTVRQLRYAFKYCTQWRDHIPFLSIDAIEPPQPETATLRLLTDPFFIYSEEASDLHEVNYWYNVKASQVTIHEEDKEIKLCLFKVIALGILLCHGGPYIKVSSLYRIVNQSLQSHVCANDEEFIMIFEVMIRIATGVLVNREMVENKRKKPDMDPNLIDADIIDEMREDVIDTIFGHQARVERIEWLTKMCTEVKWLLDAQSLRAKVKEYVKKKNTTTA
jgi:hypothetical protein